MGLEGSNPQSRRWTRSPLALQPVAVLRWRILMVYINLHITEQASDAVNGESLSPEIGQ